MASAGPKSLTAVEFLRMPNHGKRTSLVRGELIERKPPGAIHGLIAAVTTAILKNWSKASGHGLVGVESGFVLGRNPDTVRAPDVFFVRNSRLPADGVPEAFWELAPDLAVEIVSPKDTAIEIREKVRDYHSAGTSCVWVVYPRTREVVAFTPDGRSRTFSMEMMLSNPALLPGFEIPVSELFTGLGD